MIAVRAWLACRLFHGRRYEVGAHWTATYCKRGHYLGCS